MKQQASLLFFRTLVLSGILAFASHGSDVSALEIKGATVPSQISCGESSLVLNGTAVRSHWGFNVYVCALYLAEKSNSDAQIMTEDTNGKRVHISMLRGVSKEKFESTIRGNIDTNFSAEEKKVFAIELEAFLDAFGGGKDLAKGSVVNIDYIPEQGMSISVDDTVLDVIPGKEFYHAILRLWIGSPPQQSIKTGLLGQAG